MPTYQQIRRRQLYRAGMNMLRKGGMTLKTKMSPRARAAYRIQRKYRSYRLAKARKALSAKYRSRASGKVYRGDWVKGFRKKFYS